MTDMNMPDRWMNEGNLVEHLSGQLLQGRLGLFLGAGVSIPFGLPSWQELVRSVAEEAGDTNLAENFDPIKKAGAIKIKYFSESKDFNAAVSRALYRGRTLDFAEISQNKMLQAIGSLVMSSRRGSAAKVFTLNFDDLLELYLEFHGFTTAVIHDGCHWAQNEDVVIYHPHGYLPLGHDDASSEIVLGTSDFHNVMASDQWRPVIQTALRQHTFLYIGLSGEDMHLHSHWNGLSQLHAISGDRVCYHGVRFKVGDGEDDLELLTRNWGIHTHGLADYNQLPDFLFKICQRARELRMQPTS